jgi:hypothetical protein
MAILGLSGGFMIVHCVTCKELLFGGRADDDAIVILIHVMSGHVVEVEDDAADRATSLADVGAGSIDAEGCARAADGANPAASALPK